MCLVVALISLATGYMFFESQNYMGVAISVGIALFFIALMIRNILKTKSERKN